MFEPRKELVLFDAARVGIQAQAFLSTKLGEQIQQRSAEEAEDALIGLGEIDPGDFKEIARLQRQYRTATHALQWLLDMIQDGVLAEEALNEEDDIDG